MIFSKFNECTCILKVLIVGLPLGIEQLLFIIKYHANLN